MDRRRTEPPQNLWALHEKVGRRWILLIPGLRGQAAVDELIARQDAVRRSGQPCRFKLLPEGEPP